MSRWADWPSCPSSLPYLSTPLHRQEALGTAAAWLTPQCLCGGCKEHVCRAPHGPEASLLEEWALSQHPASCKPSLAGLLSLQETSAGTRGCGRPPHPLWGRGFGCALLCSCLLTLGHGGAEWGHPVNRKSFKQRQEELLLTFGGAFPVQGVPVCSFQLVNSGGGKDEGEQET